MEPAARECRVGVLIGGDTGEHFLWQRPIFLVLHGLRAGRGTALWLVRLDEDGIDTLLSPERTDHTPLEGVV